MYNGVIATSLYGGSNIKGTIYGDVNILMAGGEISNSLYGGGKVEFLLIMQELM